LKNKAGSLSSFHFVKRMLNVVDKISKDTCGIDSKLLMILDEFLKPIGRD